MIEKNDILLFIFLIIIVSIFFYYGLQAELWYPDDGLLALFAKGMVENNGLYPFSVIAEKSNVCIGMPYYKPPFSIDVMSILFIFGESIFKLFTPISIALVCISIFLIAKKFVDVKLAFLCSILFVGIPTVIFWSLGNNTDTFTAFIFLWLFYSIYRTFEQPNKKNIILSSMFVGLIVLTKEIMYILPIIFFIVYFIISRFTMKNKPSFKNILLILILGFLIASPFFIRNYILYHNPIWPFAPNIFGWDYLDKEAYYEVYKHQLIPNIADFNYWWDKFTYIIPILVLTLILSFYNIIDDNLSNLAVTSAIAFMITFFISPANDTRYLIPLIPALLVIFAYQLESFSKIPNEYISTKNLRLIILVALIILGSYSVYSVYSNLPEILKTQATIPEQEKILYKYIKENAPTDSVLLDVSNSNTAFHTNKETVFPYQFCGYELWKFWEKPQEETRALFKKHGINYVIFRLTFMTQADESETWGMMPVKAINYFVNSTLTDSVFEIPNWAIIIKLKT